MGPFICCNENMGPINLAHCTFSEVNMGLIWPTFFRCSASARIPKLGPDPRSLSLLTSLLSSSPHEEIEWNTKREKKERIISPFSLFRAGESMEIRAPPTSLRLAPPPPASASFRRTALRTSFLNGSGAFRILAPWPISCASGRGIAAWGLCRWIRLEVW